LQAQDLRTYKTAKPSTFDQLGIEPGRTIVPPPEASRYAHYSLASTGMTIPALVESESLEEKIENDEEHIIIDNSNPWNTIHPYSNAAHCSYVAYPEANSTHEEGISILEDFEVFYENTTLQSCFSLINSRSQFSAPAIRWPASQFNDFQNDCKDRLNLRYDVNLGAPRYNYINSMQKSYQFPKIDGGGRAHGDCSRIPSEEANANPIPTTIGGGSGPLETYCKGGIGQVTALSHDHMYNINPSVPCDLDQIYFS